MSKQAESCAEAEEMVRTVQVDVFAIRDGDDILFTHAWKRQGEPARRKGKIVIPHGEGDVPIHFHLRNKTDPRIHLEFLADPAQAMWVDTRDCPTGAGNGGGQIRFNSHPNPSPDPSHPNQLIVTDDNSGGDLTLHYALRFTGDVVGSGPPYEYDPIIKNGGGG